MANVKAPMAPVRGPVSKPAVMPANKDRYTTDMGMDEMGRMPPPVNRSPGGPSGDMIGGRMPPPVNKSPGGPSQKPTPVMPPPATTGGNMRPPGGPANTGVVPPATTGGNMAKPAPAPMATTGGNMSGMAMGAKPVDTTGAGGWKKGGKVKPKCYAKGGSVRTSASSRGDGCATKGHTKGVMR